MRPPVASAFFAGPPHRTTAVPSPRNVTHRNALAPDFWRGYSLNRTRSRGYLPPHPSHASTRLRSDQLLEHCFILSFAASG